MCVSRPGAGVAGERLRRCRIYLHESEREGARVFVCAHAVLPKSGPCLFLSVSYVYISSFTPSEDLPTLVWC